MNTGATSAGPTESTPTKPRRNLPQLRLWGDIACALRLGGGLLPTLKLLVRIGIREGWKGYIWRLRLVQQLTDADPEHADHSDYERWDRMHEHLGERQRLELALQARAWTHRPRISVLMPVFNPRLDWLEQAVESVRQQIYPDWELCIADDASTTPGAHALLQRLARADPRIKLVLRQHNGHICAASNTALAQASGEFVALLDHDDLLSPHALYCVAQAIGVHPDAGLLYSDEDKVDGDGRRSAPYFKPAFNYDLFLSQNLVSHLGVYSRALVQQVGGFRPGTEGSQDYDLALRCVEHLRPQQIVHIARVLYHWRVHAGSTASDMAAKPYAAFAAERALNAHLARQGQAGRIDYAGHGYRHQPPAPIGPLRVSLLVLLRPGAAGPLSIAEQLRQRTSEPIQEFLWVGDPRLSLDAARRWSQQAAQMGAPWFGEAHGSTAAARTHAAASAAQGEHLALLCDGVQPRQADWLSHLLGHSCRPGVGTVGPRLWLHDGRLAQAGLLVDGHGLRSMHHGMAAQHYGYFGRAALTQNFRAVSSTCYVVRRSLYREAGGLHPAWHTMRHAVADLCLRLHALGHRTVWAAESELEHSDDRHDEHWHAPHSGPAEAHDGQRWAASWGQRLPDDQHYNPNLDLAHAHCGLAWPPRQGHLMAPDGAAFAAVRAAEYTVAPWSCHTADASPPN